ncbi:MAG: response regulator transcription factor [Piscirickettsiaceae bacterium]|nr:response regulator transcription factor [Piscirickettsiaceae bacterium]
MKILIIDDHQLYLEGMRTILNQLFVGSHIFAAHKISDAFDIISGHDDIDIILLDVRMPHGGAPAVLKKLCENNQAIPVLVVSASENSADVQMALSLGALGYLPKSSTSADLNFAIEMILQGNEYLPENWVDSLKNTKTITSNDGEEKISLSPRLYEVLQLIEKGCTTPEVSHLLELSEHTVKGYIKELFSRFNVHNRTELIQTARQLHFFSLST